MKRALFIVIFAFAGIDSAKADMLWVAADLGCDTRRDTAVARFTTRYNDDAPVYATLPKEVDNRISEADGTDRRTCTLSNGWDVRLRVGSKQAFPYGAGGAGPSKFFSLWVNHRKVISRRIWLPGYNDALGDTIVAVVVTPTALTTCAIAGNSSVTCTNEPLNTATAAIDEIEYPPPGVSVPTAGSMQIAVGANNKLCRALVKTGQWDGDKFFNALWDFSFSPDLQPDIAETSWVDPSILTPIDTASWPSVRSHKIGPLDIDHDGRDETVIKIFGGSNAFDGTYWFAIENGVELASVETEIFPDPNVRGRKKMDANTAGRKWSAYAAGQPDLYPGVLPDFVHLDRYMYQGRIYFLAHATHERHDPTAILIKPLAKGRFETVCKFQIVRPNF